MQSKVLLRKVILADRCFVFLTLCRTRTFNIFQSFDHQYHVLLCDFLQVNAKDLQFFEELLPGRVVTDEDELLENNTDWLRIVRYAD